MQSKRWKIWAGKISIFAFDLFLVLISFVAAFLLRRSITSIFNLRPLYITEVDDFLIKNWWLITIYIVVFLFDGFYFKNRTFWEDTKSLIVSTTLATIINFAIVAIAKLSPYISRLILVFQPLLFLTFAPIFRYFYKKLLYKLELWRIPLLELRINTAKSLEEPFKVNKYLGYEVVKSLQVEIRNKEDVNKVFARIKRILKQNNYPGVVFSVKYLGDKNVSLLIEKTFFIVSKILIVPDFIGFDILSAHITHLMYENLFVFDTNKGLNKPINRIIKRIIDIIAAIGMLIFLGPLLLLALLITFLGDGFPLLYPHKRFGKNGKIFKFLKVRSMVKDNDKILEEFLKKNPKYKEIWDKYQKLPEEVDPRLIKGGWFIRKTHIDELAQVINLLKGEMSLVGPRPYMPRERKLMGDYFERVTSVKPGITGLWQVSGGNQRTFQERLQIDVWYIQNWSLWLDFVIILKTILLFLKHGGGSKKAHK